jgi:hypothetical protein
MAIDPTYASNVEKTVDNCTTCADLKKIKDDVEAQMAKIKKEIADSIAALAELMTPPVSLDDVVSWISKMTAFSFAGPYAKLVALQAEMAALEARLAAKIASKTSDLHCHF